MKNNIDIYRKELKEYVYNTVRNATFDDWHFKYLKERLDAEILRDRLRRCKKDNNELKKQYTDMIDFLLKGSHIKARSVADVCGMMDIIASNIILQMLLKYKKIGYAIPCRIIEEYSHKEGDVRTSSRNKWDSIIDKIILAFTIQTYVNALDRSEEDVKALHEGMKLFIEYIDSIYI